MISTFQECSSRHQAHFTWKYGTKISYSIRRLSTIYSISIFHYKLALKLVSNRPIDQQTTRPTDIVRYRATKKIAYFILASYRRKYISYTNHSPAQKSVVLQLYFEYRNFSDSALYVEKLLKQC